MDREVSDLYYRQSGGRMTAYMYALLCAIYFLPWYFVVCFGKSCSLEIAFAEAILIMVVYFLKTFSKDNANKLMWLQLPFIFTLFELNHVIACVLAANFHTCSGIFVHYFFFMFPKALIALLFHVVGTTLPCTWYIHILMAEGLRTFLNNRWKSKEDVVLGAMVLLTIYCWWYDLWTLNVLVNFILSFLWVRFNSRSFGINCVYITFNFKSGFVATRIT